MLEAHRRQPHVFANHLLGRHPFNQPRRSLKAKLQILSPCGQHINMVVRMIADGMALVGELRQPRHIRLFEYSADTEIVDVSASLFDSSPGFDRVGFRGFVEISLFKVPMRIFPGREVGGHFQIQRDRDLSC